MPSPACPSAQFHQKKSFFLFTFLEKPKKTSSCCFSIQSATKYESKDKTHKEFANWDELMRHGIRNFERSVNFIFQKIEFRTLHDGRNSSDTWNRPLIYWARLLPFTRAHNSVVIPIRIWQRRSLYAARLDSGPMKWNCNGQSVFVLVALYCWMFSTL